ncbi:MAG: cache domain-containing protein [Oscillospiraceae bacterium]
MNRSFTKKIKYIFTTTVLAVIIISVISSFFIIKNLLLLDFEEKVSSQITMSEESVRLQLSVIEEMAPLIMQNKTLLNALKSDTYQVEVVPLLNSMRGSNSSILGLSVYGSRGIMYTSDKVVFPPTMKYLKECGYFENVNEKHPAQWVMRMDKLQGYYMDYQGGTGLLTYFSEIRDENGEFLGYLVLDTFTNEISQLLTDNDIFKNNDIKILYEDKKGNVLPSDINNTNTTHFSNSYKPYTIKVENSNMTIKAFVSDKKVMSKIWSAFLIIICCCLVLIILFIIVLKSLIKSFTLSVEKIESDIVEYAQSQNFDEKGDLADD